MKNSRPAQWLFILFLLSFALFYILPFFISILYSVMDNPINKKIIGISNYSTLFKNKYFLLGIKNTITFLTVGIPLNIFISLMLAIICVKLKDIGNLLSFALLIPYALPTTASAFVWKQFFSSGGILNGFLGGPESTRIDWLNSSYAMLIVIIIFLWKNIGYNLVLFVNALSNVPKGQYQSSEIDGANSLNKFIYITLPNIVPSLFTVFLLTFINSFRIFKEIYILTGNSPPENLYTLQHFMNNMFSSLEYGKLTSASGILTFSVLALIFVIAKLDQKTSEDLL